MFWPRDWVVVLRVEELLQPVESRVPTKRFLEDLKQPLKREMQER